MNSHKILILCCYYNRPNMVQYALNSVLRQDYENWELVVVDDGSVLPAEPVVRQFFEEDPRVQVINTGDSTADKIARGGSVFGKFWNDTIRNSDADLALMLCDDDALVDGYLSNLNKYFSENPQVPRAFSHVIEFDPFTENPYEVPKRPIGLNHEQPTPLFCRVDSSQVCWRTSCNKLNNIWFPFPQTWNLDAHLYGQFDRAFGPAPWTGFDGQYKGLYHCNLHRRGGKDYEGPQVIDLPNPPVLPPLEKITHK